MAAKHDDTISEKGEAEWRDGSLLTNDTTTTRSSKDHQQQHPTDAGNDNDQREQDNDDEHDVDRIFRKLSEQPAHAQYPELMDLCRPIVQLWYDTYADTMPKFWKRLRRNLPKELNESAFILHEMIRVVNNNNNNEYQEEKEDPLTIIDMCSGIGYLSMFLSHLLPPDKVSRIVPIDTLFQNSYNTASISNLNEKGKEEEEVGDNKHLSIQHFQSSIHPIEIRPRKADIKSGRELRQIAHYCIAQAPGPVIILGVHLCKALSVHTVRLFNAATKACRLYLKPCCLPGRKHLRMRNPPFWVFEEMNGGGFGLETLYYCSEVSTTVDATLSLVEAKKDARTLDKRSGGEEEGEESKGHGNHGGESGGKMNDTLFTKWVQLLCDAANTGTDVATASVHYCSVQEHHIQNQYIVATR